MGLGSVGLRKDVHWPIIRAQELLVARRHIINYNFWKIFFGERVDIGDGLTVYKTMR